MASSDCKTGNNGKEFEEEVVAQFSIRIPTGVVVVKYKSGF
jgi:hypothetical protein